MKNKNNDQTFEFDFVNELSEDIKEEKKVNTDEHKDIKPIESAEKVKEKSELVQEKQVLETNDFKPEEPKHEPKLDDNENKNINEIKKYNSEKVEEVNEIHVEEPKAAYKKVEAKSKTKKILKEDKKEVSEKKISIPKHKKLPEQAIRQTYHIDKSLVEKVHMYSYIQRLGISEVVNTAITEYLKDKDFEL